MITKTTNPETLTHKTGSEAIKADAAKAATKPKRAKAAKKGKTKQASSAKRKQTPMRKVLDGSKKVTLVTKKNPFATGSKRAKKWACLKSGTTVDTSVEKMAKAKLPSRRSFITFCQKEGHIKLS